MSVSASTIETLAAFSADTVRALSASRNEPEWMLQKRLDARIGMNMVGDLRQYTQFQVAESMPIAAALEARAVITRPFAGEGMPTRSYVVAKHQGDVIGYSGMMFTGREAHVTNIAVDPDFKIGNAQNWQLLAQRGW